MRRYELSDGKSHKFWAIERDGKTLRFRYGRIGTDGQALAKSFASPTAAEKEEAKLVAEKTKKGYRAVSGAGAKTKTRTPATATAAADPRALMKPLGRVWSEANFIALVAVDGVHASAYRYPFDEDEPDHLVFEKTMDGPLPIGKGTGLIASVGGSGYADVRRFGDAFVLADLSEGEDDVDAEEEMLRAVAGHPTTKPKRIGVVDVSSGVLVLMGQHERGPKLDLAKVKKAKAVKTKSGIALAVTPGRYEVWREEFYKKPIEGDWGSMDARVRVVREGTKVTPGEPLVALQAAPEPHRVATATATATVRLLDAKKKKKWSHTRTIARAPDGRLFAGQHDAYGVAAWNVDGSLAWQIELAKPYRFGSEVRVQYVGDDLLALAADPSKLLVLDPRTGKTRRALTIPTAYAHRFLVHGDLLFVMDSSDTFVLRYPAMKEVTKLAPTRANCGDAACSPDGRIFAHSDNEEAHIFDTKTWKHLHTIKADVSAVAFTADGKLLLGSNKSAVRIIDSKTGQKLGSFDVAKDRARKPSIEAIACTPKHIAVSRVDGTTVLLDAQTRKVLKLYEKHTTQAYFGPPILFSQDGRELWVGACPKGEKPGLSGYDVPG